jgi:spermidine/putrescine transport system substrate-binding protein
MKRLLALALALGSCGPAQPELRIFTWSEYFAEGTIPAFEKETGCVVRIDYIESSEKLRARLEGGASGFDVVFPSDEVVPTLIANGLLEKLDLARIPNAANVGAAFKGQPFDPKNEHSLPYMTGTTGIAYHVDKVKPAPTSWADVLNDQAGLVDDAREVFAAALKAEGAPWTPEGLAKAAKRLEGWKPKVWDSNPKAKLVDGDVAIAQSFSGDALQAAEAMKGKVAYVIPKEGGTLWIDNLCVAKGARQKELAHKFIDFLLRPEISAAITNERKFGNPNEAAKKLIRKELLDNPLIFPTDELKKRLDLLPPLSPDLKKLLDKSWASLKAR